MSTVTHNFIVVDLMILSVFIYMCNNLKKIKVFCPKLNKRPMSHIAHLRKQFKSINTYDYIMTLIKRRKNKNIINFMRIYWFLIWTNLNPLHPRILCAKFAWNWLSGSEEEDFFKISSMYFRYFVFISPWKRAWLFIW